MGFEKQKDYFLESEGDEYYRRNKSAHVNFDGDHITEKLASRGLPRSGTKILEVGCADGFRLNYLQSNHSISAFGLEPSQDAVEQGTQKFPDIELKRGVMSDLPFGKNFFDLILINFVFHWVDRSKLFSAAAEINRVLKEGGFLLVSDFYRRGFTRRAYNHVEDDDLYTFKQNYSNLFESSGLYERLTFEVYEYQTHKKENPEDFSEKAFLAILQKKSQYRLESP